ncbi:MAG: hypothetical protein ACOYOP_07615 [Microthrixaceae bacterium]
MSGDTAPTVADVLAARLRELGVRRTWGLPLADLDHVPVDDADLAVLLADADGRLGEVDGGGRLGAALLHGGILHLSSAPGGVAPLQTVGSVEELLDALAEPAGIVLPATTALHLDLALDEPVAPDVRATASVERVPVLTLSPSLAGLRLVVLAGTGVVRARAVPGLHDLRSTAVATVVLTWGARGAERRDSPYLGGVGGLQTRDLALAGLDDADVIVLTGVDPAELPEGSLEGRVVQEVPPRQLAALCAGWPTPPSGTVPDRAGDAPALAVPLQALFEDDAAPVTGARAALQLAGVLPDRGVCVADPGPAGFWVARSFPTSIPGSSCVPATVEPGFAVAAALVAAMEDRPCVAVVDDRGGSEPLDPVSGALLDLARATGRSVAVQAWSPDGPAVDAAAHVELLQEALAGGGVRVDRVGVRTEVPDELVDLAGPPVASFGVPAN